MSTPVYRDDHWVLTQALDGIDTPDVDSSRTACGLALRDAGCVLADGYYIPNSHVTCPDCMATEQYQAVITTIEIGFDGNAVAWWLDLSKALPRLNEL